MLRKVGALKGLMEGGGVRMERRMKKGRLGLQEDGYNS